MSPDDKYPKIKFETGEIAWIRYEIGNTLGLIFADLSASYRIKEKLPEYVVLSMPHRWDRISKHR